MIPTTKTDLALSKKMKKKIHFETSIRAVVERMFVYVDAGECTDAAQHKDRRDSSYRDLHLSSLQVNSLL